MMKWRFLKLEETPRFGILLDPDGEPTPARFLTVAQARAEARQGCFKNSSWKRAA